MSVVRGDHRRSRPAPHPVKRRVLALLDAQIRRRPSPDASQAAPPPVDGRGFAHEGEA